MSTSFILAIEEQAYAMGVLGDGASNEQGNIQVASDFLAALLGPRPRLETEGRLLAASHALVARDLLDFDADTGAKSLAPALASVLHPLLASDYSVRCARIANRQEQARAYYVSGPTIIEHSLHRQVAVRLETVADSASAAERCLQFWQLPADVTAPTSTEPLAVLPASLLETLRAQLGRVPNEEIAAQLRQAGMGAVAAAGLAADLGQAEQHNSAMRIEQRDGQAVANEGFLLLQCEDRLWLLTINPVTPPTLTVQRADSRQVRYALVALFHEAETP